MIASLALLVALQATPSPAASTTPADAAPVPSPAPTDNPQVAKLARAQFTAFKSGKIDTSQYSMAIPQNVLPQVQAYLSELGPVQSVTLVQSAKIDNAAVYVYKFTCQNGATLEQLSVKDGKINGIYFRPVQ